MSSRRRRRKPQPYGGEDSWVEGRADNTDSEADATSTGTDDGVEGTAQGTQKSKGRRRRLPEGDVEEGKMADAGRWQWDVDDGKGYGASRGLLLTQLRTLAALKEMCDRAVGHMVYAAYAALQKAGRLNLDRAKSALGTYAHAAVRSNHMGSLAMLDVLGSMLGMDWRLELLQDGVQLMDKSKDDAAMVELLASARSKLPSTDISAAASWAAIVKGRTAIRCNNRFIENFVSGAPEVQDSNDAQEPPLFFWTRMLAPEAKEAFVQRWVDSHFAADEPSDQFSLVSVCISHTGAEALCRVKYRSLQTVTGSGCCVTLTPISPPPSSQCRSPMPVLTSASTAIDNNNNHHNEGSDQHVNTLASMLFPVAADVAPSGLERQVAASAPSHALHPSM